MAFVTHPGDEDDVSFDFPGHPRHLHVQSGLRRRRIQAKIAQIAPSAAQTDVANKYCAVCAASAGQTTAACQSTFFQDETSIGIGGEGQAILPYNDAFTAKPGTSCVPGAGARAGCGAAFESCVSGLAEAAAPNPAACK